MVKNQNKCEGQNLAVTQISHRKSSMDPLSHFARTAAGHTRRTSLMDAWNMRKSQYPKNNNIYIYEYNIDKGIILVFTMLFAFGKKTR